MPPRPSAFLLAAALLAAAAGCRHKCGDRCDDRPFGLTSGTRAGPDCRLVGSGGRAPAEGCFDAVTGRPVPCPPVGPLPPAGAYPLPGGQTDPADVLPFPAETIPRPAVPFAPPSVAPPGEGASRDRAPVGKTAGKP
ncbi:MAG: hypothetical protein C0501_06780 [Isosphaera sp.]|nr:hypothetical protein [Isosphaera sp.]